MAKYLSQRDIDLYLISVEISLITRKTYLDSMKYLTLSI
ncbi:hypothetical protein VCRA2133E348_370054 [Vibrio crassostreae]|nr:hypothetical protein VCRA2117O328_40077 [Vibrio crassostreae]CAK2914169.1 hypothetical protein VCRA2133E348_370054 [Vibrio crassostreae]CAK3411539.1 hypothetical protein VCRA213O314_380054 [Vibrio crassostreae]